MKDKSGCFEVILIRGEGAHESVIEERTVGGNVYAIAQPDLEYSVKINIYKDRKTKQFPVPYLRIGLYCDGVDVNYWKRVDLSEPTTLPEYVSAKFQGFQRTTEDIRTFKFATPGFDSVSSDASKQKVKTDDKPLGAIRVVFFEATVVGGVYENKGTVNQIPGIEIITGDRKFWQVASVTTTAGRRLDDREKETYSPLMRWTNKTSDPMKEMVLKYHQSHVLDFIEHLSQNDNSNNNNSSGNKRGSNDDNIDIKFEDKKRKSVGDNKNKSSAADTKKPKRRVIEDDDDDDDEIQALPTPVKFVPLLDLTDDDATPAWTKKEIAAVAS